MEGLPELLQGIGPKGKMSSNDALALATNKEE
jgi:hypothetical protein